MTVPALRHEEDEEAAEQELGNDHVATIEHAHLKAVDKKFVPKGVVDNLPGSMATVPDPLDTDVLMQQVETTCNLMHNQQSSKEHITGTVEALETLLTASRALLTAARHPAALLLLLGKVLPIAIAQLAQASSIEHKLSFEIADICIKAAIKNKHANTSESTLPSRVFDAFTPLGKVEEIIINVGLKNVDPDIRKSTLQLIKEERLTISRSKQHVSEVLPLRHFVGPLVKMLDDLDLSTRAYACETIKIIFTSVSYQGKKELALEMLNQNTKSTLTRDIQRAIGFIEAKPSLAMSGTSVGSSKSQLAVTHRREASRQSHDILTSIRPQRPTNEKHAVDKSRGITSNLDESISNKPKHAKSHSADLSRAAPVTVKTPIENASTSITNQAAHPPIPTLRRAFSSSLGKLGQPAQRVSAPVKVDQGAFRPVSKGPSVPKGKANVVPQVAVAAEVSTAPETVVLEQIEVNNAFRPKDKGTGQGTTYLVDHMGDAYDKLSVLPKETESVSIDQSSNYDKAEAVGQSDNLQASSAHEILEMEHITQNTQDVSADSEMESTASRNDLVPVQNDIQQAFDEVSRDSPNESADAEVVDCLDSNDVLVVATKEDDIVVGMTKAIASLGLNEDSMDSAEGPQDLDPATTEAFPEHVEAAITSDQELSILQVHIPVESAETSANEQAEAVQSAIQDIELITTAAAPERVKPAIVTEQELSNEEVQIPVKKAKPTGSSADRQVEAAQSSTQHAEATPTSAALELAEAAAVTEQKPLDQHVQSSTKIAKSAESSADKEVEGVQPTRRKSSKSRRHVAQDGENENLPKVVDVKPKKRTKEQQENVVTSFPNVAAPTNVSAAVDPHWNIYRQPSTTNTVPQGRPARSVSTTDNSNQVITINLKSQYLHTSDVNAFSREPPLQPLMGPNGKRSATMPSIYPLASRNGQIPFGMSQQSLPFGNTSRPAECQLSCELPLVEGLKTIRVNAAYEIDNAFQDNAKYFEGRESEDNWSLREKFIIKIRAMLHGGVHKDHADVMERNVNNFAENIVKTTFSLRTTVASHSCNLISDLSICFGHRLSHNTIGVFAATLAKMASFTKKIVASVSQVGLRNLIIYCKYQGRVAELVVSMLTDKNVQTRTYGMEQLHILLQYHTPDGHYAEGLSNGIKKCLSDSAPSVREAARKAFRAFESKYPDKAASLVMSLDPQARKRL